MNSFLENEKFILKTWRGNGNRTVLLALPNAVVRQYGLEKPAHLVLEKQENGFFLKKLEV